MDKISLRARILDTRKLLNSAEVKVFGLQVQYRFIETKVFSAARGLALYSPILNEVATDDVHRVAIAAGKRVYYPRINKKYLDFVQVNALEDLVPGRFCVLEPVVPETITAPEIDVIVVPGVAFDRRGHRLGFGGGYYDRFLSTGAAELVKVGLCYDFQLCDMLPEEQHDQRLDYLVTDTELISCLEKVAGST